MKLEKLKNKKYLPLALVVLALGILTSIVLIVRSRNRVTEEPTETSTVQEVALVKRPIASLLPSTDGHWLTLVIKKLEIKAESMDYELLYDLPDGRTQGVPGTITLKGEEKIERKLLLGSESSGKFRYDEGVKEGQLTLRFRDAKGKLVAKFTTKFHLQSLAKELSSIDGKLLFTPTKGSSKDFFVTMETFGVPADPPGEVLSGPYGVFSSSTSVVPGTVKLGAGNFYRASGSKWEKLESGKASDIGIFLETSGE
ncbi:hypothetical protein HY502_03880 [Candidatus Woesebacteria bacterium]|nr:hypothetical protein [Candidatus Woesebacteria bacterium]